MPLFPLLYVAAAQLAFAPAPDVSPAPPASDRAWIARSNQYALQLFQIGVKYSPEFGSSQGLTACDEKINIPTVANQRAARKETEAVLDRLKSAQAFETNKKVSQDLGILVSSTENLLRLQDCGRTQVPYINPTSDVYAGISSLLDDQAVPERRKAALIRLSKYAGLTAGFRPISETLKEGLKSQMDGQGMEYPSGPRVELELARNPVILEGIKSLFRKYQIVGWEAPFETLKSQLVGYDDWVRKTILPKAKPDFRMTPDEYAAKLVALGIDISPGELVANAHESFVEIQAEMAPIAAKIAAQRKLPSSDYRFVIAQLKKDQVPSEGVVPLYQKRLSEIEKIIRDNHLVSLPGRTAVIRLATPAESAREPEPHMDAPPFVLNTGQRGVFVLPVSMPASPGQESGEKFDDFTFDAVTWTMVAHESRPGHELQFDTMVESGTSQARALYAFNSANVEGWGVYAESIIEPYMPLEGQLVSLDWRLLRTARAFLDPELQSGKIQPEDVIRILTQDVAQSRAFAREELERYEIIDPGQAGCYFYGFTKMKELRKEVEERLGKRFNAQRFHDFVLSQGLLPPKLMRKAVIETFIPTQQG